MKKQLLTSAMAVAMLAPTVGAFAATNGVVDGSDKGTHSSYLDINGQVMNQNNQAPEGQLSVTLPTTASFVVGADGALTTPDTLTITNNSSCAIEVKVSAFTDNNPNGGITVVEESQLKANGRDHVMLTLSGTLGDAQLLSTGYTSTLVSEISGGASETLALTGKAGDSAQDSQELQDNGANDSFRLTFTVAKSSVVLP